jgi:hypothetical protein
VIVLLRGFAVARAGSSDAVSAIRFRFEVQSTATGSSVFRGPKTDYWWGEVTWRGTVARLVQNKFYPCDPKDSSKHKASISEHFVLDENTVITCQKDLEFNVGHAPQSVEEAKSMHKAAFAERRNQVQTLRYFDAEPSVYKKLTSYYFLGATPDGPIRTIGRAVGEVDGRPVIEYTSGDGTVYRFVCDEQRPICWKWSVTFKGARERDPYARVSDMRESEGDYVVTSTSTRNPSSAKPYIVRETERIFDVDFNYTGPIAMTFTPKNGDRIDSLAEPQIKYQWQDGKIEKVYDPLTDEAGRLRFVGSSRWIIALNLAVVLALAALIYWRWRKRGMAVLVVVGGLLTASAARASDSYCGVYSLYGAAKSLGIDADLEELIDAQYISSHRGSTADDLVRAAESIGLEATPLKALGIDSLKAAQQPLILHAAPMGNPCDLPALDSVFGLR